MKVVAAIATSSAGSSGSSAITTSSRMMEASPRGPNQPMNETEARLSPEPVSAIATGPIRMRVRVRTPKATIPKVRESR